MKEALILFLIAIVIGSLMNSFRQIDSWGTPDTPGSPARNVATVTENSFDEEVVSAQKPVLVYFYSDNSADSKAMVPVVADVANSLKESLKVVRVDADENPELTKRYDVVVLPQFFFFKGGAKLSNISGKLSEEGLLEFLKRADTADERAETGGDQSKDSSTKPEGANPDSRERQ